MDTPEKTDVTIARMVEQTHQISDSAVRRAAALQLIEQLLNGANLIANVMEDYEREAFCVHVNQALAILDNLE